MSDRRAVAYHEAGHVVGADELGVLYDAISILPADLAAGRVSVEDDDCFSVPLGTDPYSPENERAFRAWAEQQSTIDYAGHAAVVAILGIGDMSDASAEANGASDDFDKARARLVVEERVATIQTRATEIISRRREDVRKVAEALIDRGRLSGQQAMLLLEGGDSILDRIT